MKRFKINVKKLLIIYSAIVIAAGIITSTALINKRNNSVEAAPAGWTAQGTTGQCNGDGCTCPAWATGGSCDVWLHNCPSGFDASGKCLINASKVASIPAGQYISWQSIVGGMSCTYVQIDVNRPGDTSWWDWYGAVKLAWTNFSSCGQPPVNPPPPPPVEDKCPYTSTQARVQASVNSSWVKNLEVDCGSNFIVGSFHNATGAFANDTQIRIFNPGSGSVNARLGNGAQYQTSREGRYRVLAVTKNKSGGYYSEAACRGEAYVTCTNVNPGFRITKVATNDNGPYDIGDTITFRVEITNTGNAALKSIAYHDYFDNRYMRFVSVTGVSPAHPNGINMTSHFTTSVNGHITTFSSNDITAQMGDLPVGGTMHLDYVFTARSASSRVCNDVFAKPTGLSEKQARDCVGIILRTDK
jgi:uncharacterized repeat protein (TIGR01451 family)